MIPLDKDFFSNITMLLMLVKIAMIVEVVIAIDGPVIQGESSFLPPPNFPMCQNHGKTTES